MTEPSADVVLRPHQPLNEKIVYAEKLANSGLLPQQYRKQPANILYAMEYGDMLGLSPMAAIVGVHVIEGKPTASAGLIGALVRRAGHKLRVTGDDKKATAQIIRRDDPEFTFEAVWTIERAKQANLTNKNTWKNYPAAMLKARAITEVARDACEEALLGVHYTPEELGAEVTEEGTPLGHVVETKEIDLAAPDVPQPKLKAPPPGEDDDVWALPEPTEEFNWDSAIANAANDPDALRELWRKAPPEGPLRKKIELAPILFVVDQLLVATSTAFVDSVRTKISPKIAGRDITGLLTKEQRIELNILPDDGAVTLLELADMVVTHLEDLGYSVAVGIESAAAAEAAEAEAAKVEATD
jgi:hypothetical protein